MKQAQKYKKRKWARPTILTEKKCSKCGILKNLTEFYSDKRHRDGKRSDCINCYLKVIKSWADKNPQKQEKYTQHWRMMHRDHHLKIRREAAKKFRLSPKNHLSNRMSCSIGHSLQGNKKGNHWEKLVGYTVGQLKKHLEKQFKEGMAWENYGRYGWEIDHIVPISAFNFSSPDNIDFKRCWALKNLRPLWRIDNRIKNDKLIKPFQPSLLL